MNSIDRVSLDPSKQADAMIEACEGDKHQALALAHTNLEFSHLEDDQHFWDRVAIAIQGRIQPVCGRRDAVIDDIPLMSGASGVCLGPWHGLGQPSPVVYRDSKGDWKPVAIQQIPDTQKVHRSACVSDPDCRLTAGYYIGGGQWICWMHALVNRPIFSAIVKCGQKMQALPRV